MIKIITDSTNDLSKDMLDKLDVDVIPLNVSFSSGSYLDGVEITTEELYKKVSELDEIPKTAAIPIMTFVDYFSKYINQGYDVIYFGISRQMSRTYENALLAKEELESDKIYIVDSMNLSTGIGLLVLKACKYRDNNMSAKEIADRLNIDNKLVLSQFAIERMDFLHKGGRCSSIAKLFGTLLKIKPIIAVRDGKMHVMKKPIGKMKIALDIMIKQIVDDKDRLDTDHIIVTHSLAYDYCDYIVSKLKVEFPNVDIITSVAGCVISSHCGKGTIGILYMVKE
ncbi:TPA: DegV family protein [Candidatus Avacholeplasma faecigallinarum]|nr:DegV family protein [Candidatus Avacholeplasma faecigallinarum]